VPIDIGGTTVHFLVSHPTPPVFDGAEDRNGRRNHDEIRLWADYITPGAGGYIYDDAGGVGGLKPGSKFVIAGDQNSDPFDGDSVEGAAQQLIDNPRVNTTITPRSDGAVEASALQGGANLLHEGDPQFDTADFADTSPGNLRAAEPQSADPRFRRILAPALQRPVPPDRRLRRWVDRSRRLSDFGPPARLGGRDDSGQRAQLRHILAVVGAQGCRSCPAPLVRLVQLP
jgi:hypothetical protein